MLALSFGGKQIPQAIPRAASPSCLLFLLLRFVSCVPATAYHDGTDGPSVVHSRTPGPPSIVLHIRVAVVQHYGYRSVDIATRVCHDRSEPEREKRATSF